MTPSTAYSLFHNRLITALWLLLVFTGPARGDFGNGLVPGGLMVTWYQGQFSRMPDLSAETPAGYGVAAGFDLSMITTAYNYAVRYEGYIQISVAGEYSFFTTSDDGSILYIGNLPVVNNDGLHGMQTRSGTIALTPGSYPIRVEFFQSGGGAGLSVGYKTPAGVSTSIPLADLSYDPSRLPSPREPDLPTGALYPGVAYDYCEGNWPQLPDFDAMQPLLRGQTADFNLADRLRDDLYAFRFQAYLLVTQDGLYTFYTHSDDGSALYIGNQKVVDNDGLHAMRERSGAITLKAGLHRITTTFFEAWGGDALQVQWTGPGFAKQPIAREALLHTLDMMPPLKPADVPRGPLLPQLAYEQYAGNWTSLPDFAALQPQSLGTATGFDLSLATTANQFGFSFKGFLQVPSDGVYRFYTTSSDGSRLWIGDKLVVDNDREHSLRKAAGSIALAAGTHAIRVDYFERWGSRQLIVEYRTPEGLVKTLPVESLFHTADQLPALREPVPTPAGLQAGVAYGYREGAFQTVAQAQAAIPKSYGSWTAFNLTPRGRDDRFGFIFEGYLDVPEDGFYRFATESDDGSRLWIGDQLVVDNDGLHAPRGAYGSIGLKAGLHPIKVAFFESYGGELLKVSWRTPSGLVQDIPASRLFHSASQLPALLAARPLPVMARPGVSYRQYEGTGWSALPDFAALSPVGVGALANFSVETGAGNDNFGLMFDGYIQVPANGFYDFFVNSDDGSRLWIDDQSVVDNDGLHAARDGYGNVGLAAGWHRIQVGYFDRGGSEILGVSWRQPGGQRLPVPNSALAYDLGSLPTLSAPVAAREALISGLRYDYYEWASGQPGWQVLPDLSQLTPAASGVLDGFSLAPRRRNDRFALRFTGFIDIPEYGYYTFWTTSDDGSRLSIDGQLVVDNDGLHSARERSGRIGLQRGRHAIRVDFFEWHGGEILNVDYAGPHFPRLPVSPAVLSRVDPARNEEPGEPGPYVGPGDPSLNQAPTAVTDLASTGIGAGQAIPISLLANDSDPDGDIPLLLSVNSKSGYGAALIDSARGQVVYYPPLGFVGQDQLTYTLGDRRGGIAQGQLVVRVGADAGPLRMSAPAAARFLTQASFGPTKAGIAELMRKGPEAWIDEQLALPPSLHAEVLESMRKAGETSSQRELRVRAWLDRAVTAPDQLRQRVAFALSEILVVSDNGNALATDTGAPGLTDYYDLLVRNAFGSYRQILGQVTLHPAMGLFLNMAGNQKADVIQGTVPDENYAREILQLFSVGLWKLTPDGQKWLDTHGQAIPSYTRDDVMQLAKVFTGWDFAAASGVDRYRLPLILDESLHEGDEKRLLDGTVIPAGQGGVADLGLALDRIAGHPNLAPFIARQLIQRLVTSNPSPAYIGRVAATFRASGLNVGTAVKAILLDPEARSLPVDTSAPVDGKLREPLLQLTALWRGLGVSPGATRLRLDQVALLGQTPGSAPSVFNFFKHDYQSPGEIANLGLYSPELEAMNEKQVMTSAGLMDDMTLGGRSYYDLNMELAFAGGTAAKAIGHLSLLFQGGRMSDAMVQVLADSLFDRSGLADTMSAAEKVNRMLGGVYLILTSPEFQTQR